MFRILNSAYIFASMEFVLLLNETNLHTYCYIYLVNTLFHNMIFFLTSRLPKVLEFQSFWMPEEWMLQSRPDCWIQSIFSAQMKANSVGWLGCLLKLLNRLVKQWQSAMKWWVLVIYFSPLHDCVSFTEIPHKSLMDLGIVPRLSLWLISGC